MVGKLVILKGKVRGRSIELENETALPEGQPIIVGIMPTAADGGALTPEAQDQLAAELESEIALQTIHRMRHAGRSVREL